MNFVEPKVNKYLLERKYLLNVFSPEECKTIINFTDTSGQGTYTEYGHQDHSSNTIKSKYVRQTSGTNWVWDRIKKQVWHVNESLFNFDINSLDDLQIMEYQKDSLFQWHIDINGYEHFTTRKLSIVVFLTEREQYGGGQLLFDIDEKEPAELEMKQGSMIIFPAFQIHTVTPVTFGLRHTLVAWAHGKPFS